MLVEDGEKQHWERLKASAGVTVTFRQGASAPSVVLVPARDSAREAQDEIFARETRAKQFIASVLELKAASVWPPGVQNSIEFTDAGGEAQIFDVAKVDDREWVPMGNHGVMVRINTNKVDA
ncbi:MAG: hypothetical protein ACPGLY_27285 [Rubripirellula sp.]